MYRKANSLKKYDKNHSDVLKFKICPYIWQSQNRTI
jgi:hypothetical protein